MEIEQLNIIRERLKSMSKTFWNYKSSLIILSKNFRMPLQKSWRIASNINSHIKYGTTQAGNKLHFSMWGTLIVHSSYDASLCCFCMIDLDNLSRTKNILKLITAK